MRLNTGVPGGHVVIVGAGLAGVRTCQQLRSQGFTGRLTVLSLETEEPYDRPPLSKEVLLGTREHTPLAVDFHALAATVRYGVSATGLRAADHIVHTTEGDLDFDGLVIATGARPIRLPGDGTQHTLRTIGDAWTIRDALVPGARIVLVGASWIGAEVATAAVAKGCQVTCVEATSAPSSLALGADIGARLLPWWGGVEVLLNTAVATIGADSVALADGSEIAADLVVVGVGVRPDTEWLTGSGVHVGRGVTVDERLSAAEDIVAVGDVAAWWSQRYAKRLCVEHWDNAASGATVAASTLLAADGEPGPSHDPIPYFWSDQFGHKVQYVGHHDETMRSVVRTDPAADKWGVGWFDTADRLAAMMTVDNARDFIAARRLLMGDAPVALERFADGAVRLADAVAD